MTIHDQARRVTARKPWMMPQITNKMRWVYTEGKGFFPHPDETVFPPLYLTVEGHGARMSSAASPESTVWTIYNTRVEAVRGLVEEFNLSPEDW